MSRRGDNIRKRSDGRWEGRYRTVSESGEVRYRSVYGKSYGEVKEKLADSIYRAHRAGGIYRNELAVGDEGEVYSSNFCALAEEWLLEIEKSRKYSTYIKYKTLYQCPMLSSPPCCLQADKKLIVGILYLLL